MKHLAIYGTKIYLFSKNARNGDLSKSEINKLYTIMKSLKEILKSLEGLSDIEIFVIDLFCGAGGLSEGVEEARLNGRKCAKVVCCVNHDKNAILSHDANIPDALHFIEDIRTLELSPINAIVARIRQLYPDAMIMLHASLECTNFSKAKGGQPRDADSRTLARKNTEALCEKLRELRLNKLNEVV